MESFKHLYFILDIWTFSVVLS